MKVVHINTNDIRGGAGRAAFRLHYAMQQNGIDSCMLVLNKHDKDNLSIYTAGKNKRITRFMTILKVLYEHFMLKKYRPFGTFSIASFGFNIANHKAVKDADIVYFHWVNRGLLSLKGIKKILETKKTVYWVLHDMWGFTGGCHYSFECKRYLEACGACPLLKNNSSENDISKKVFLKKQKYWSGYKNLHIVTPSAWLGACAKKSVLFKTLNVNHIPNTIDLETYKPIDTITARNKFGLKHDVKIILFLADSGASNPYKGWSYLEQALKQITQPSIEAVVLGSILDDETLEKFSIPVHCIGNISDDFSLACIYSAADVFVLPSLVDNFPNTIVESMVCGTPVVGFNIGGIPNMIEHNKTGYLADYKNVGDLKKGIEWVLSKPKEWFDARNAMSNMVNSRVVLELHKELWERDK